MAQKLKSGVVDRGVLKTGVIGAGVFGAFHARKNAALPRADFVGVYDADAGRASMLAAECDARSFASADALFEAVEAVTIAAPAPLHFPLAQSALLAGLHVYVEKPLALTLAEADALIALASRKGLVLQVGHQERFVLAAMGLPRGQDLPRSLEFGRAGPPTGRGEDVPAALDLMIHDLDLARLFGFSAPVKVDACGSYDETIATLTFDGGRTASFVASRRASARRRAMKAVYDDGAIEIDFLARTILNDTRASLAANDFAAGPAALNDPLGASIDAFIAAILDGGGAIVDGRAGRGALEWALMVEDARTALAKSAGETRKSA